LDLPIDHFRLLGVGPASDAQTVLRTLQLRLDRPPEEGFTAEALQARAELLRASADLLSDGPRRAAYEADLTALAGAGAHVVPALEIPSSKEVGGLLLLFESDQPLEAFEIACRSLQPPQAPALGSSREADLTLLAGLACLGACTELEQQRRYERAAQILQQGLQLLQRMGQRPDLRDRMTRELERLTPYRVLDLLNRDLASTAERREGLALLEQLVERRGGLEGEADFSFPPEEFRTFFKQIRSLLTVQEQVDLFSRWGDGGSPTADFLATTALTASGFAQRKPERIAAARQRLLASQRAGIEPLLANLSLLLGEVDTARASFEAGASRELRAWAERQSADPLGQLCAYCRDWLSRDVLPGYRDLEADADLDAYFADRDVQRWVERHERAQTKAQAQPTAAPAAPAEADTNPFSSWTPRINFSEPTAPLATAALTTARTAGFTDSGSTDGASRDGPSRDDDEFWEPSDEDEPAPLWPAGWRLPALPSLDALKVHPRRLWITAGAGAGVLLIAAAVVGLRLQRPAPTPLPVEPIAQPKPAPAAKPVAAPAPAPALPLKAEAPSEAQLRTLLEAWLEAKATVLAGREPNRPLDALASPGQVASVQRERTQDQAASTSQEIKTAVEALTVDERDPNRIAATVQLRYANRRLDAAGQPVEKSSELQLTNRYVFSRGADGIWRMVSFRKA